MGVVNVNAQSFFAPSRVCGKSSAYACIARMQAEGAQIIDIGGQSTAPAANRLDEHQEWEYLREIVPQVSRDFPDLHFSIDTFYLSVAQRALDAGFTIVNDVSAGAFSPGMFDLVQRYRATFVCNHTMAVAEGDSLHLPLAATDTLVAIKAFFAQKIKQCNHYPHLWLDPGFGFGKKPAQNFDIVSGFEQFTDGHYPVVAGVSRKRFIYQTLHTDAAGALNGTTAIHMILLQKGTKILRVHDVKAARECIDLARQLFPV